MSEERVFHVREDEEEELYKLLVTHESTLSARLDELKRRLERYLYQYRSIADMERIVRDAWRRNR